MSIRLLEKGREGIGDGTVDLDTNTISLLPLDFLATDTAVKTITGATNATPIVVTATAHGFANGDIVIIGQVLGNLSANGTWKIANVTLGAVNANGSRKINGYLLYKNTGTGSTSRAILINDGRHIVTCAAQAAASATTIAVERLISGIPSGTVLAFSNGASATLSALANAGDRTITVSALAAIITAGSRADAAGKFRVLLP